MSWTEVLINSSIIERKRWYCKGFAMYYILYIKIMKFWRHYKITYFFILRCSNRFLTQLRQIALQAKVFQSGFQEIYDKFKKIICSLFFPLTPWFKSAKLEMQHFILQQSLPFYYKSSFIKIKSGINFKDSKRLTNRTVNYHSYFRVITILHWKVRLHISASVITCTYRQIKKTKRLIGKYRLHLLFDIFKFHKSE